MLAYLLGRMVSGVDDGVAERVTGGQEDGSGDRCSLGHGGGECHDVHCPTSDPSASTHVSGVAICSAGCGSEGQGLTTSGVTSVQIEVSYAFFPPIGSTEVAVAIASSQGVNYQGAEACYASSWGRGERTGGIDVGRERARSSVQLVGNGAERSTLEPDQMRPQDGGGPLSDILTGRRELDMVMRQADREDGSLRWLHALDMQVLGACRADERLNPLLRWNFPCLGSDDQLLAHLGQEMLNTACSSCIEHLVIFVSICDFCCKHPSSPAMWQHFKLHELGQLARCLCAPLVSVRVGKVLQHGRTLRPITTRGYLSLTMLPSSELRLSYVGDNGVLERLAVMSPNSNTVTVALEELVEDSSGRTFVLKLPEGNLTYFWQSEKSKARGGELIAKMKDLLTRQPTLAGLTGLQDSRLDLLASYVRSAISSTPTQLQTSLMGGSGSGCTASDNLSRQRTSNQLSIPGSSPLPRPWHHMSHMSLISQLGESRQELRGITSLAGSSSSIFQTGQAWNATVAGSLSSRCVPSVVGRPRCDPVCSNATCITGASSVSVGYSTSTLRNALDVGSIQNSWSTRTSIWSNQDDDVGVPTSHSAGLYTSLQHIPCVQGDNSVSWNPSLSVTHSFLDLPVDPSADAALPSSTFVPSVSPCTIPPRSPYIPISTSLLAPYYCPCPLSTSGLHYSFAPSDLPAAVRDSSFVQPSTSVISVVPPLLPQSFSMTLAAHQSPVTTPLLPAGLSDIPVLSFLPLPSWTSSSSSHCDQEHSSTPSQFAVSCQDQQLSTISLFHRFTASWEDTRQATVSTLMTVEQANESFLNDPQQQTELVDKHSWHHSAATTTYPALQFRSSVSLSSAEFSAVGAHEQRGQKDEPTTIANTNSTDSDSATLQICEAGLQPNFHLSTEVTCTKRSAICAAAEGHAAASCNDTTEIYRLGASDKPFVAEPES